MNRAERRRGTKLERGQTLDLEGIRNNQPAALQNALNLIGTLMQQKRLMKARKLCDAALAANPNNSQLHHALGVVHQSRGDMSRAAQSYQDAVAANPANVSSWVNLGICARTAGTPDQAIAAFEKAIDADPNSFHAHYNLGLVHCDRKDMGKAVASLNAALKINPSSSEALFQLGFLEELRGNHERAIEHYRALLKGSPNWAPAHTHVGACLQMIGRFEEGAEHLKRAVELNPRDGRAHFLLASSRQAVTDSAYLAEVEKLARDKATPRPDSINMLFAAGRMREYLGSFEAAFNNYKAGNDLRNAGYDFDPHEIAQMARRVEHVFTPDYVAKLADMGDPSDRMVFVVGIPRSGTTLVEQIIATHPEAEGVGELANLQRIFAAAGAGRGPEEPDILEDLTAPVVEAMVSQFADDIPEAARDARRVVDKTPGNALWLGVLYAMFPNAAYIHCERDPMDTLWSCYAQNFHTDVAYACDFHNLAAYHKAHNRVMEHWRNLLPKPIHNVRYEDLVADPETHIRRIVDAIGLEWDDRCLDFHRTDRSVQTTSLWQVRRPMFSSSIGKWKRFEPHIAPLREALEADGR